MTSVPHLLPHRYKGVQPSLAPPDPIQEGILNGRISQLEATLKSSPQDAEALESLAVSYAQLFKFEKAAVRGGQA